MMNKVVYTLYIRIKYLCNRFVISDTSGTTFNKSDITCTSVIHGFRNCHRKNFAFRRTRFNSLTVCDRGGWL